MSRVRRFFLLTTAIICVGVVLSLSIYLFDAFRDPGTLPKQLMEPANDSTFVFLSDTQAPLWPETFVLDVNQNDRARSMVFSNLLSLEPGAVFHCGDVVALGFNQTHWEPIDEFTETLSRKGIPFFPVPGNHEYMIFRDSGLRNFQKRFPISSPVGYTVMVGPLAFVLLNSNIGAMTTEMLETQDRWYLETMNSLEADSLVRGIIVACHHAPYTNSRIVDPSGDVQQRFVPRYVISPKGKLFITGHCHAFEHFRQSEKDFLVIGGGGGLQQPLHLGGDRLWVDLFPQATEKRMFHYLSGVILPDSIRIVVRMLEQDFSGFENVYSLDLPW